MCLSNTKGPLWTAPHPLKQQTLTLANFALASCLFRGYRMPFDLARIARGTIERGVMIANPMRRNTWWNVGG
jgi:hypothetical protein